ncbi:hypothetical protein KUTeg_005175 [Tegillarca granosa]|uniref:Uncharacterized protein n=1 Tax=Tegillarca granosa TaxID=220873 RepID=A0ABQ9FJ05_TEGGR|nr:hypothetical protein KUTeg_005175 [Tegillarca granosa]
MMEREQSSDDEDEDIWEYKTKKRLKNGNASKNESSIFETDIQNVKTVSQDKNTKIPHRKQKPLSNKTKTAKDRSSGKSSSSRKLIKTTDFSNAKLTKSNLLVCSEQTHVSNVESKPIVSRLRTQNSTSAKPWENHTGNCPSCQMPLSILNVQTPSWHVAECLDLEMPTTECPDGLRCESTIESHYRKFSHYCLAQVRSTQDKVSSGTDKQQTFPLSAKIQLELSEKVDTEATNSDDHIGEENILSPSNNTHISRVKPSTTHSKLNCTVTVPVETNVTCSNDGFEICIDSEKNKTTLSQVRRKSARILKFLKDDLNEDNKRDKSVNIVGEITTKKQLENKFTVDKSEILVAGVDNHNHGNLRDVKLQIEVRSPNKIYLSESNLNQNEMVTEKIIETSVKPLSPQIVFKSSIKIGYSDSYLSPNKILTEQSIDKMKLESQNKHRIENNILTEQGVDEAEMSLKHETDEAEMKLECKVDEAKMKFGCEIDETDMKSDISSSPLDISLMIDKALENDENMSVEVGCDSDIDKLDSDSDSDDGLFKGFCEENNDKFACFSKFDSNIKA